LPVFVSYMTVDLPSQGWNGDAGGDPSRRTVVAVLTGRGEESTSTTTGEGIAVVVACTDGVAVVAVGVGFGVLPLQAVPARTSNARPIPIPPHRVCANKLNFQVFVASHVLRRRQRRWR